METKHRGGKYVNELPSLINSILEKTKELELNAIEPFAYSPFPSFRKWIVETYQKEVNMKGPTGDTINRVTNTEDSYIKDVRAGMGEDVKYFQEICKRHYMNLEERMSKVDKLASTAMNSLTDLFREVAVLQSELYSVNKAVGEAHDLAFCHRPENYFTEDEDDLVQDDMNDNPNTSE